MRIITVFDDLASALSPYVGGLAAAQVILGLTTILILFVGFLIMFGKEFFRGNTGIVVMLIAIGFVSAPGVNWFPIWVPFLVVFSLAFMYWQKYL